MFSDMEKHTHAHTSPDEAKMMSTVILRQDKGPLASFSVSVSSWEHEVCLLVSECVTVHSSFLAVNYIILLHCCLMELLFDGMSVYLCVHLCALSVSAPVDFYR